MRAHYIAVLKANHPTLHAAVKDLPWKDVPLMDRTRATTHGRDEIRRLKAATVPGLSLEDFLGTVLDPPADLLSATEDDLVAYRRYRTALQPSPVKPATWRRNRVSIDGFYDRAVDTGLLEARPYRVRRNGRDALSGGSVQDLDVRHLTHRQWVLLHRVGLGGDLSDGSPDPSFRGGDRHAISSPSSPSPPSSTATTSGDLKLQKRIMAGCASVPLLGHRVVLIAHLRRRCGLLLMW